MLYKKTRVDVSERERQSQIIATGGYHCKLRTETVLYTIQSTKMDDPIINSKTDKNPYNKTRRHDRSFIIPFVSFLDMIWMRANRCRICNPANC